MREKAVPSFGLHSGFSWKLLYLSSFSLYAGDLIISMSQNFNAKLRMQCMRS
jgi:hypothetical protein